MSDIGAARCCSSDGHRESRARWEGKHLHEVQCTQSISAHSYHHHACRFECRALQLSNKLPQRPHSVLDVVSQHLSRIVKDATLFSSPVSTGTCNQHTSFASQPPITATDRDSLIVCIRRDAVEFGCKLHAPESARPHREPRTYRQYARLHPRSPSPS